MHSISELLAEHDVVFLLVLPEDSDAFTKELQDLGFHYPNGEPVNKPAGGFCAICSNKTYGGVVLVGWVSTIGLDAIPHYYYGKFRRGEPDAFLTGKGVRYPLCPGGTVDIYAWNQERNKHPGEHIPAEKFLIHTGQKEE
jgi:hypothetical protein